MLEVVTAQAGKDDNSRPMLPVIAFTLLLLAAWMLQHLYWGLAHDAVLYTMQALAHLHPDLYSGDVFLRYGSQDRFTLFSPIYAAAIAVLGVNHAGALLTVVSSLCFFAAAWLLARRLMSARMALLALAMLVAMEMPYGNGGVFHIVEDFVTPRLPAEALTILSLWAILGNRWLLAAMFIVLAGAFHPIMACAGVVWLIWLRLIVPHPKSSIGAAALISVACLVATQTPLVTALRMDDTWLSIAREASYLLVSNWNQVDLSTAALPLTTLLLGIIYPWNSASRLVSLAALGTGALGLLLASVGSDWLHLTIFLQAQPWRWLWLSTVIAPLTLPLVISHLWSHGRLERALSLLLGAAYAFHDAIFGFEICLLILALAGLARSSASPADRRHQNMILGGAATLFILGTVWDIANRAMFSVIPFISFNGLPYTSYVRRLTHGSLLPPLLLGLSWYFIFSVRNNTVRIISVALAAAACLAILPASISRWTLSNFPLPVYEAFAPWRRLIPPRAEVLMPANPLFSWIFLERPSYLSQPQSGTALFSREAALEIRRRAVAVAPFLKNEGLFELVGRVQTPDDPVTLKGVCERADLRYIVTRNDIGATPLAELPKNFQVPYRGLKLYRCGASG